MLKGIQYLDLLNPEQQVAYCRNRVNHPHSLNDSKHAGKNIADFLNTEFVSFEEFVDQGFLWEQSTEGYSYWYEMTYDEEKHNTTHTRDVSNDCGLHYLLLLPYRIQVRFLKNLADRNTTSSNTISNYLLNGFSSFDIFIMGAFTWSKTIENVKYWTNVIKKYEHAQRNTISSTAS